MTTWLPTTASPKCSDRSVSTRRVSPARLTGTVIAIGLGLAFTGGLASASADPVPPVDPAAPLPAEGVGPAPEQAAPAQTMLGQFAAVGQSNPFNVLTDLIGNSPQPPAVGMAPPPGSSAADPWTTAQLLLPQNFRMPSEDQNSPYALAPNSTPSPFARIDAWKGVHAMVHGSLGRMPGDQLGQALPGTAASPGSNLPPGLEQFYVDPAATPVVPPPADPVLPGVTTGS